MNASYSLDFSLYQVKLFLTVAETHSFSNAAEELYIEQSTLSRRISMLEQELGVSLFDRKSRPIQLTTKGEMLYGQWKPLLSAFEHTLSMLHTQRDEDTQTLNICIVDSGIQLNDVPEISRMMQGACPEVSLAFHFPSMSQWKEMLDKKLCDVAITITFDTIEVGPEYMISEIVTVPKLVCMLRSNPLSGKTKIVYEDLTEQHFISIADHENPRHAEFIRRNCRQHGFEPKIDRRSQNAHGLTSMLQHDDEVLICDRFLRGYDNPLFKLYQLPDTLSGLCAVYPKHGGKPYLQQYLQVLRTFYNQ